MNYHELIYLSVLSVLLRYTREVCTVSNMTIVVDYLQNVNEIRETNLENQLLVYLDIEIIRIEFMPYTREADEYLT